MAPSSQLPQASSNLLVILGLETPITKSPFLPSSLTPVLPGLQSKQLPVGKRLSHLVSLKTTHLIQKLVSGKEFPGLIRGSSFGQPLIVQFVQLPSLQHFSLVRNPGMGREEML
jgi:hypothetical protein